MRSEASAQASRARQPGARPRGARAAAPCSARLLHERRGACNRVEVALALDAHAAAAVVELLDNALFLELHGVEKREARTRASRRARMGAEGKRAANADT